MIPKKHIIYFLGRSLEGAYVTFMNGGGQQSSTEQINEQIPLKNIFNLEDIPFYDEDLDCVVLKFADTVAELPPPLEFCFDTENRGFSLITQRAQESDIKKCRDKVNFFLDPSSDETHRNVKYIIRKSEQFLRQNGKDREAGTVTDDMDQLRNPHRVLFNCCSAKGASGAPGIIMRDGKPYVVTMLLHGYPNWYYKENLISLREYWPDLYTVEQGIDIKAMEVKVKNNNRGLYDNLFPSCLSNHNRGTEPC